MLSSFTIDVIIQLNNTNVCTGCFSMGAKGFRNLLQYVSSLDKPHQERIYYELQRRIFPSSATIHVIDELRDKRFARGFSVPIVKVIQSFALVNTLVVNVTNVKNVEKPLAI